MVVFIISSPAISFSITVYFFAAVGMPSLISILIVFMGAVTVLMSETRDDNSLAKWVVVEGFVLQTFVYRGVLFCLLFKSAISRNWDVVRTWSQCAVIAIANIVANYILVSYVLYPLSEYLPITLIKVAILTTNIFILLFSAHFMFKTEWLWSLGWAILCIAALEYTASLCHFMHLAFEVIVNRPESLQG